MMEAIMWLKILSVGGLLFSGYLSGVKFFSSSCALGESCPYFLNQPACYYGLVMYTVITILVFRNKLKWVPVIAIGGMLFSGYFVVSEGFKFSTCALGMLFYLAIAIVTVFTKKQG
jgi:hypothetical protein